MRKVAFLSFDWDYEVVSSYYYALQSYLEGRQNLQLTIFGGFGHFYQSYEPEPSSFDIFSLCRPWAYDGFIVQGNRTWPPMLRQQFVDNARAFGKPVVSINYGLKGATYVGTDNYHAMYELVHTIISDRGCASALFVNGLASSLEAQERARGYAQACKDANVGDVRFCQGSWMMEEGIEVASELLEDRDNLPEVIFCANDDLAVGLTETLQKGGVRIPEDVMVTGFDNRKISLRTLPRITSVSRDYATTARCALDTLELILDGHGVPERVFSPVRCLWRESCGYMSGYDEDYLSDLFSLDNSIKHFSELLSHFQSSVLGAESLAEIMDDCERYGSEARCKNVYLSIESSYLHPDDDLHAASYGHLSHLMAHVGSKDLGAHDEEHVYATFPTTNILPAKAHMGAGVFCVLPLRHDSRSIGTIVTEGVSPAMHHGLLNLFITLLAGSVEHTMRRTELEDQNTLLDELYVRDELTGLFNRFGLDRFGTEVYDRLLEKSGHARLTFVDIDDMKGINDNFGHEFGDEALRLVAEAIRQAILNESAFAMRYGGDEFLLISEHDLSERIERMLKAQPGWEDLPCSLAISCGSYEVSAQDQLSMAESIRIADERMYAEKRLHKEGRS